MRLCVFWGFSVPTTVRRRRSWLVRSGSLNCTRGIVGSYESGQNLGRGHSDGGAIRADCPVIEESASEEGIWPELIEEVAQVALDSPETLSLFSVVRAELEAWSTGGLHALLGADPGLQPGDTETMERLVQFYQEGEHWADLTDLRRENAGILPNSPLLLLGQVLRDGLGEGREALEVFVSLLQDRPDSKECRPTGCVGLGVWELRAEVVRSLAPLYRAHGNSRDACDSEMEIENDDERSSRRLCGSRLPCFRNTMETRKGRLADGCVPSRPILNR